MQVEKTAATSKAIRNKNSVQAYIGTFLLAQNGFSMCLKKKYYNQLGAETDKLEDFDCCAGMVNKTQLCRNFQIPRQEFYMGFRNG